MAVIALAVVALTVSLAALAPLVKNSLTSRKSVLSSISNVDNSIEAESATSLTSPAVLGYDTSASGSQYVQFGTIATATPTPSSTTSSSTNFQPTAPYYATFFYPWYGTAADRYNQWDDSDASGGEHNPPQNWFSNYLPDPNPNAFDSTNELYRSTDDATLYWQLSKLKEANQEVAISSWWGQTHKTNVAFGKIIKDVMNRPDNPYPNLRWTLYYECEGVNDGACGNPTPANPTVDKIVSDLNYIKTNYASQPGYLKIGGKPVIFVYNAAHAGYDPLEDLSRWKQARALTGFYVVMKVDPLHSGANPADMDGWHEYGPASRTTSKSNYWFSVSPGFWLNGNAPRLAREIDPELPAFKTAVSAMKASSATWKLTETWNEWGEGSGVEPADAVNQTTGTGTATIDTSVPFKNLYVDALHTILTDSQAN